MDDDSSVVSALLSTQQVISWSETPGSGGALLDTRIALDGLADRSDSYYLDWPRRRWLIAVPDHFCRNPDDPDMLPCLVQFRR